MSGIVHCPRCGHHINIPSNGIAGYCPICDKEVPDKGLVEKLRLYGSTQPNGQMGDDCRIPKNVLLQAADRIEVLSGVRAASS